MTSFLGHSGTCDVCGCFAHVWVGNFSQTCDDCHTRDKVRADYAADPALAATIYGAATADDALRLLGVDPK